MSAKLSNISTNTYKNNKIYIDKINKDNVKSGITTLYNIINKYSNKYIMNLSTIKPYAIDYLKTLYDEETTKEILNKIQKPDTQDKISNKGSKYKTDKLIYEFTDINKKLTYLNIKTGFIVYHGTNKMKNFYYDNIPKITETLFNEVETITELKEKTINFLEGNKKLLILKSRWGTGKTSNIMREIVKRYTPTEDETMHILGDSVLFMSESNTTNAMLSSDFNFISHQDEQQKIIDINTNKPIKIKDYKNIVCSIQSINKIKDKKFNMVVIDEYESVFSSYYATPTFKSANTTPEKAFIDLLNIIDNAEKVVILDADITEDKAKLLIDYVGNNNYEIYKNNQLNFNDTEINIYQNLQQFINAFTDTLKQNKKIAVATATKNKLDALQQKINKNKKVLYVSVDGVLLYQNGNYKKFDKLEQLKRIEQLINDEDVEIFCYTPSIKTGLSINELYFDEVFCITSSNTILFNELIQMIFRVRKLKQKKISLYLTGFNGKSNNITIETIKRTQKLNEKEFQEYTKNKDYKIYDIDEVNQYYYELQSINNKNLYNSHKNYVYNLLQLLKYHKLKFNFITEKGYNSGNTTDSGYTNYNAGGTRNTVVGSDSMKKMTTGDDNVIIGAYSSNNLTTGYQNVIIGANSSSNKATTNNLPSDIYNAVGIGFESYPTASNTIRLGNANHTNINTSATLTLGEITIPNTDGSKNTFLITDGSGNLSFTNYEVKPHLSNVTFDGSNAIIVEFSRDISNSSNYNPSDFSVVHDGSSIEVLSVYEISNNLALNLGVASGGGGGSSGGSGSGGGLSSQLYYESFDNEDVTLESTHDTVYVTGRSGSGKALSTIGQTVTGLQWIQKTADSTLPTDVIGVSFFMKFHTEVGDKFIFDNRDNTDQHRNFYIGNSPNSGAGLQFQTPTNTSHLPDIYYNGTLQPLSANASTHSVGNIDKLTLQDGNWHHFYLEYPSVAKPTSFTWFTRKDTGTYGVNASIDDLRYFNAPLSTSQITDLAAGNTGAENNASSNSSSSSSSSSAVDVPIDLDKLKFTYTKSVDGSNNIVTTDGFRLGSFYYNGLGLTNLTNEEFSDLSDISLNATTLVSGHMIQYNGTQFTNIEPTITDISFNSALLPDITNTRDIGSTSRKIKDMHVAGTIDVATTITTSQLSVGTATYPNTYGNINQFLRSNNTGTLFWSHVYLNDLYDVNTASFSNNSYLNYSSSSNGWVVTNLPNDNLASITQLDQTLTDLSWIRVWNIINRNI